MTRRLCPTCEREASKLAAWLFAYGCAVGGAVAWLIRDHLR